MGEIHDAVKRGDLDEVRRLLSEDRSLLQALDDDCMMPLHVAAEYGNAQIVCYLLSKGADIDAITQEGNDFTALDLATASGALDVVHALLDAGARLDLRDDYEQTPIHTAAIFGHPEIVEILLQHGAKVNDRVNGWTPLTYAEAHLESGPMMHYPHRPAPTKEDYKAVVDVLRKNGGVV